MKADIGTPSEGRQLLCEIEAAGNRQRSCRLSGVSRARPNAEIAVQTLPRGPIRLDSGAVSSRYRQALGRLTTSGR